MRRVSGYAVKILDLGLSIIFFSSLSSEQHETDVPQYWDWTLAFGECWTAHSVKSWETREVIPPEARIQLLWHKKLGAYFLGTAANPALAYCMPLTNIPLILSLVSGMFHNLIHGWKWVGDIRPISFPEVGGDICSSSLSFPGVGNQSVSQWTEYQCGGGWVLALLSKRRATIAWGGAYSI